ncbi:MLO-like protein 8 [Morus notabilis]|uniref:MLO-like protein n=1 Tax=Morus notabilis TaxID=981085 RepID=W9RTK0_9ROSA|nr:MLO-like protein 8 [Morus notabilis]
MKFFIFSSWSSWAVLLMAVTAMAASSDSESRKLDQTPTWAVAGVCTFIIIISIVLEKVLHKLGTWFTERHKISLFEALEKVKAELMILGFISLLLTFSQSYIAKICIPKHIAETMLPCSLKKEAKKSTEEEHRRRLLWFEHRFLAGSGYSATCKEGKESLISVEGLHELHILIFFLAFFHVLFSGITMMLGRLKIRGWKKWEQETSTHNYEFSNGISLHCSKALVLKSEWASYAILGKSGSIDPSRFRLTHETSFVRAHTSFWTPIPFFFYVGCFFRQFFRSVSKADYMTLRNGFITVHLAPGSKFNFQKYIKRSLEDDFKIVVGCLGTVVGALAFAPGVQGLNPENGLSFGGPVLWASFVVFLLLNVQGWQALFWASLIPLIIILAVGTELQSILTKMALEITERHAVVQGIPLVQGSDQYFWFGRPHLVLHLIHFALFQYSFGLQSCFHANFTLAIMKLVLGVGVLCLCSYITLPLYALVTQMGSRMKKSIFDEQTSKALKKWHMAVKKKHGGKGSKSSTVTLGGSSTISKVHSSGHTLHRFKTTGHSTRSSIYDDTETSDMETELLSPTSTADLVVRVDNDEEATEINGSQRREEETRSEDDFSFVKPAPQRQP